jgi:mannose-6-phosphate isomerase
MTETGKSPFPQLAPFRIAPLYDPRVWGYRDLRPWFDHVAEGEPGSPATGLGRRGGERIGEVWLTGDECLVETGAHAGKKLSGLFREFHPALLGAGAPSPDSPLLIKVLFAREKLSVQVHPDDKMAQKYGDPRGKTECWYVLAAEPGAQVACGLKPGVTLDDIQRGIEAGTLEESLNALDLAQGEMVYVDAGTVHAIWPGSILLETQQNCDLTYRMYDYGRGRELHIKRSLEATRIVTRAGKVPARPFHGRTILMDGEYFRIERIAVDGSRASSGLPDQDDSDRGLQYLFAAGGSAGISGPGFDPVELPRGGILAVPAAAPEFAVRDLGSLDLIRITPRWPEGNQ